MAIMLITVAHTTPGSLSHRNRMHNPFFSKAVTCKPAVKERSITWIRKDLTKDCSSIKIAWQIATLEKTCHYNILSPSSLTLIYSNVADTDLLIAR